MALAIECVTAPTYDKSGNPQPGPRKARICFIIVFAADFQ